MAVNGKVKRTDLDDLIQEFLQWQKVSLKTLFLKLIFVQSYLYIFCSTLYSVFIEELGFNLLAYLSFIVQLFVAVVNPQKF